MGNRFLLRASWLLVKATEYSLPVLSKLLIALFYFAVFALGFILVVLMV